MPFLARSKHFEFLNKIENRTAFPVYEVLAFVLYRSEESKKVFSLSSDEKRLLGKILFKKADLSFSNREFENCLFYLITIYGCLTGEEGRRLRLDETTGKCRLVELNTKRGVLILGDSEFQNKVFNSVLFYSLLKMAECFNRLGNFKEARECLEKAEEYNKNNIKLLYLFAKNTIDDCSIEKVKINQSLSYLKKTREALNRTKESMKKKTIDKFERDIDSLSKDIKKKKKAAEKRTKLYLNRIICGCLEKISDRQKNQSDKNYYHLKKVNEFLDNVKEKYLKELRYYNDNKNCEFFKKTKKEFYAFMTIKEEIISILNFSFDLKNLKINHKKRVLSILEKRQNKKSEFIEIFEEEKQKLVDGLIKKIKNNFGIAGYIERTDLKVKVVNTKIKESKINEFNKKYRGYFSTVDCSFLLLFSIFAVLFLSFIPDL